MRITPDLWHKIGAGRKGDPEGGQALTTETVHTEEKMDEFFDFDADLLDYEDEADMADEILF